jgi:hypothetical protein
LIDLVIAGIVVGVILLLIGVSVIVLIIIFKQNRKRRTVYSLTSQLQNNSNEKSNTFKYTSGKFIENVLF